jgi:organic hydroperoxide reductase OsmC/OhrA
MRFARGWTPEHLVLAALARCVLNSLAYHARRDELALTATAEADGTVSERSDGSWGFVELVCRVDAQLDPLPDEPALADLLARSRHGCFVGSSLEPTPSYRWTVNGGDAREDAQR